MFEARLLKSSILKKVLEAIKDLLTQSTFDCDDNGIQLQVSTAAVLGYTLRSITHASRFYAAMSAVGVLAART